MASCSFAVELGRSFAATLLCVSCSTPADVGPLAMSDLVVEPNPNNTLSCFVSWKTNRASTSEVHFGDGELEFSVDGDDDTTTHRVLVIGMRAEREYAIRAISTRDDERVDADTTFTTGALPEGLPHGEVNVWEPEESTAGWTLTNIHVSAGSNASLLPAMVAMFDAEGYPVWYAIHGGPASPRGDVTADYLPGGTLLIGPTPADSPVEIDLAGEVLWRGPPQITNPYGWMSHDAGRLVNGNTVILRNYFDGMGRGGAMVEELNRNNEVVWSWSLFDSVQPPNEEYVEWCHPNSVTIDEEGDFVYLNCRFAGLFKVRRQDAALVWHLAGGYNEERPGTLSYEPEQARYFDSHDPEIDFDAGTVLLYDNGGYAGRGPDGDSRHSRVVEYAIDEGTERATLTWEFPGQFEVDEWYTTEWYTQIWGDADRLSNDNVLVTAGDIGSTRQTRIFEVTRSGRVVWEMKFPPRVGSYRAQRLERPLVQKLDVGGATP